MPNMRFESQDRLFRRDLSVTALVREEGVAENREEIFVKSRNCPQLTVTARVSYRIF